MIEVIHTGMSSTLDQDAQYDSDLLLRYFLKSIQEPDVTLTDIIELDKKMIKEYIIIEMNRAFQKVIDEQKFPSCAAIPGVCKVKLLTHLWMEKFLKAKQITKDGDEMEGIPPNWCECDMTHSDFCYKYVLNGNHYYISFMAYTYRKRISVTLEDIEINAHEKVSFNEETELPINCDPENIEDCDKIEEIVTRFAIWFKPFIRCKELGELQPRKPRGNTTASS
ncbi:uncharacterized protein LOC135831978 [Planococcus citri]|uniref:uncharacterized protein LOC135831978 n=1 Tax=Planococcus citri TaxID=170843 RepID=UPI0031F98A36